MSRATAWAAVWLSPVTIHTYNQHHHNTTKVSQPASQSGSPPSLWAATVRSVPGPTSMPMSCSALTVLRASGLGLSDTATAPTRRCWRMTSTTVLPSCCNDSTDSRSPPLGCTPSLTTHHTTTDSSTVRLVLRSCWVG